MSTIQDAPATEALHAAFFRFRDAGLRMPPVPRHLLDDFQVFDDWRFGTRDVSVDDRAALAKEAAMPAQPDYIAFGHVGHGMNSWWLCCRFLAGPLAVFVRHRFGGAYTDADAATTAIHASFSRMEELVVGVDQAQASGLLRPGQRLLVVQDDLQGSGWQLVSAHADTPWNKEPAAIDAALTFVGLGGARY
jgi:hypothetical protein